MQKIKATDPDNLILLSFIIFGLFGILNHEMWRDEMQAWMLARDSISITNLIENLRYEGHPGLWYFCLYILSQITHNILAVQLFHFLIAAGIVSLIVKYSPFSTIHKFLLSLNYFILFEYATVSRNYSLGVLFLFLFCVAYVRRRRKYSLLAVILAIAANASVYALMISIILAAYLYFEGFRLGKFQRRPSRLISSAIILGFGWSIAVLQIMRTVISKLLSISVVEETLGNSTLPEAAKATQSDVSLINLGKLFVGMAQNIWLSYFPMPPIDLYFWNRNILIDYSVTASIFGISVGSLVAVIIAVLLFNTAAHCLSPKRNVFWLYLLGNLAILVFMEFLRFVYDKPYARHYGHLFIFFVICFWLFKASRSSRDTTQAQTTVSQSRRNRVEYALLTFIFSVQAIAGVYAMSMDYLFPFSTGQVVVSYIKDNNLQDVEILGTHYRNTATIAGYLDKPIYYPERQEFGTFWTHAYPDINASQLAREIETQAEASDTQKLLLVLTEPPPVSNLTSVDITQLGYFDQSIVPDERFYLYEALARSN